MGHSRVYRVIEVDSDTDDRESSDRKELSNKEERNVETKTDEERYEALEKAVRYRIE